MAHQPFSMEPLEDRQMLAATSNVLLVDNFDAKAANSRFWHIPAWLENPSATYYGRTQIRTSENVPLPGTVHGAVRLPIDTFNPTGFSIYGSELISNKKFKVQTGLDVIIRARLNGNPPGGIVAGLFLYGLKSAGLHDEADVELLSNQVVNHTQQVQTNVYANEPLGAGTPVFTNLPAGGKLTGFHTYRMTIYPNRVIWRIDGKVVRKATQTTLTGPLQVHLNLWAPASDWAAAYSGDLQPTESAATNRHFSMDVDRVVVKRVG